MNRNATLKKPGLLLLTVLAVVFLIGLGLCTVSSYAAGENYSLTVKYTTNTAYNTGVPEGATVDLTLYKVGDCAKDAETGKWDTITMVDGLSNITLTKAEIETLNAGTEADRIEAWLRKADTIDQTIIGNEGLKDALKVKEDTLTGDGSVTFTGLDVGLYLIHGSSYESESGAFWSPRPMLVQVIVPNNTANLKPVSQNPVDEITVIKLWAGEDEVNKVKEAAAEGENAASAEGENAANAENTETPANAEEAANAETPVEENMTAQEAAGESSGQGEAAEQAETPAEGETPAEAAEAAEGETPAATEETEEKVILVKPESIDIILSYDGEPYGDPITLNEENDWQQTIQTPDGKKNPLLWTITEQQVLSGFTPEYTSVISEGKLVLKATNNTTDVKSRSLDLLKKLPVFVSHGTNTSTAFTFEITGYQGSNKAYHNTVSLKFDGPGNQTTTVEDIPLGLSRVVVKELETANYKVKDGKYEKEAELNGATYEVEFENTWDDTTNFNGSVINHYKQTGGKYVFDFSEGIVWKQ